MKDGNLTIIEAVYKLDSGEVVRLRKPAEKKAAKLENR
jgi:hypothetical protein